MDALPQSRCKGYRVVRSIKKGSLDCGLADSAFARDDRKIMDIIKQENINLDSVVESLRAGATLVYPTETCYGLGCDATNQAAVDRVFAIKERQKDKPVLVLMSDVSMCMDYIEWDDIIAKIAEQYWPGPLSVVAWALPHHGLAEGVVSENNTLAFRVTDHPLAGELADALGKPLVSTSANVSSHESPYDIESVAAEFAGREHQPDMVIDAGVLPHRSPSTVVRVKNGNVEVLRQGEIVVKL
ncbi:MAG: threonylcarbamoyl-AMP synthase [Candidatus Magasanikbacteria bacterium RIFCSPHIGHO2_02_FULL_51_14]|uniref:L-threonylcarbamoyladenylate synthase n=1 Tax=Candidatus Magasanikbacteria bacterium RIFCSPHIGHO2_02_FULL_51_14 TaxID=1798683 RepID=A0A1F6MQF6_9BACT|nr:MAG: threonylcarbamoyl-AMP synthase [Candidatus Magasanikbacteria bacterium RIFCSPHIGHO2_02_FULL_51_14]